MATPILSLVLPLLFTTLLLFASTTLAQSSAASYIIHMDLSAMPKPFIDHHSWYLSIISNPSNHIYTYANSIQGFSATLTKSELEALKNSPGYISSSKDRPLKVHTTHTYEFLGLSSSSGTWPASNSGEDVIIGLIDTGIWPESESFSDEGMTNVPSRWKGACVSGTNFSSSLCNKKLIGARFYNKGLLASNPKIKIKVNSARDVDGHGTHTASTAAGNYVNGASYFGYGNGTARGMAPRVRISIYKTIWDEGIYESDVLAAMDQAILDGVDILSLSLSLTYGDEEDAILDDDTMAIASFSAMEKGILVAAAAGNYGASYWSVVNGAPWMITVGAGTVDREFHGIISLGSGKQQITFSTLYPGISPPVQRPLVFLGECSNVDELKRNKEKIIVCSRVTEGIQPAESAGASGGIFIANLSSLWHTLQTSFPSAYISLEDGQLVIDYINKSNDPRASFGFQRTVLGTKPAPKVADFSSRGPFKKCRPVMKPDIIAPGTQVLASWSPVSSVAVVRLPQLSPLYSKFNIADGTSMATPHVAGVAALIKSAHRDWSPASIRSALMTTANPLDNTGSPIIDSAFETQATPLEMGSGHINPTKALDPGLVYDATVQDYIRLICGLNYTAKQIKIITRFNHNCVNKSLDLNYPSFIAYFQSADSNSKERIVHQFQRTVTNVGDGISSYTAKMTGIEGFKLNVEPQKLVFHKKYEKLTYKLTVEGPKFMEKIAVHGSLSWVHDGGKYVVRSPIMPRHWFHLHDLATLFTM